MARPAGVRGFAFSPLLAPGECFAFPSIYLHSALDLWAERWRRREARGNMVKSTLRQRRCLRLRVRGRRPPLPRSDPRKTSGVRVDAASGQDPPDRVRPPRAGEPRTARARARLRQAQPETFNFLDFTFICGKWRNGGFQLKLESRGDRVQAKLKDSRKVRENACINRWLDRGNGSAKWSKAGSTTTPCPPTRARSGHVPLPCRRPPGCNPGAARCGAAARSTSRPGKGSKPSRANGMSFPPEAVSLPPSRLRRAQSFALLSRSALPITLTDDNDIAAAAMTGDMSQPNDGYSTPAAIGTPAAL